MKEIEVLRGMTVRHAVIQAGLIQKVGAGEQVCDEWGNEVGLDGALTDGMKIFVGKK